MITYQKACLSALATAAMLLCTAQAQAQAQIYNFSQSFDINSFNGTVTGSFLAVDANLNTIFEASEMTFLTLAYIGASPIGALNLSFAPPNIAVVGPTQWSASDQFLGNAHGFYLAGTSATGTQMVWVAGPLNVFDFGNFGGSGGDLQNDMFRFGQIDLFTSANAGGVIAGTGLSNDWANITPIPEPATYLMMLGGIAALALRARQRAG